MSGFLLVSATILVEFRRRKNEHDTRVISGTYRLDNIADIHRFAKLDQCNYPVLWLHSLSEQNRGYYQDRHRSLGSTRSLGQKTEVGKGCQKLPSRLGGSISAQSPLSQSSGSSSK